MKLYSLTFLALALSFALVLPPPLRAEPGRVAVHHGIAFLPLDFYFDHREQLELSDEQMQKMRQIIERSGELSEELARLIRERTEALHAAVSQVQVDPDAAMARFEAVMEAENEMKALQFRTRLELRQVLRPGQYEKVREITARGGDERGEGGGRLLEKLKGVRQQIGKRFGDEVPRELLEQIKQIEAATRSGELKVAEERLDNLLRHLERGEREGGPNADFRARMEQLEAALKSTENPERREQILREIRELQQAKGGKELPQGKEKHEGEAMEQQVRELAELAEKSENPEVREQVEVAISKLREANESGNREVAEEIVAAVRKLLQQSAEKP